MIEEVYRIAEEMIQKVSERGVRTIDDAIAIKRIQSITPFGWKTDHFSLILSEDPLVCLYTTGKLYVYWFGEDAVVDIDSKIASEIHSQLEGW